MLFCDALWERYVYSKFYYFEAVGASNDNTLSDPNWQQLHSAQLFTIHSALIQT